MSEEFVPPGQRLGAMSVQRARVIQSGEAPGKCGGRLYADQQAVGARPHGST